MKKWFDDFSLMLAQVGIKHLSKRMDVSVWWYNKIHTLLRLFRQPLRIIPLVLIVTLSCGLEPEAHTSTKKPFQIIGINPVSYVVSPETTLSINFSESLHPDILKANPIRIYLNDEQRRKYIDYSSEITNETNIILQPLQSLEHNRKYCIVFDKVLNNLGNPLAHVDDAKDYCFLVKSSPMLLYSDILPKGRNIVSSNKRRFRFVFSDAVSMPSSNFFMLRCMETGEYVALDFIEQSQDKRGFDVYLPETLKTIPILQPAMHYEWLLSAELKDDYGRGLKIPELKFFVAEQPEDTIDVWSEPEITMTKDKVKIRSKSAHPFSGHLWFGLDNDAIEARAIKRKGAHEQVYYQLTLEMNGLLFNKEYRYTLIVENEFAKRHVFQNQFVYSPSQKEEGENGI